MNPLTVRHETNHSVFINAVNATAPKCEFSTMKIVGSYSAMYCFMFIAWPAWGSCEPDYKLGMFDCPVYKKIYPIYKKLEIILTNDTETRYPLRQTFQ